MFQAMHLRTYRLEKEWSQTKLFEMSGVTRRTITRAENGERVSKDILTKLAVALELTHWSELIEGSYTTRTNKGLNHLTSKLVARYIQVLWQTHILTLIGVFYLLISDITQIDDPEFIEYAGSSLLASSIIIPLINLFNYNHYSYERCWALPLTPSNIEQKNLNKNLAYKTIGGIGIVVLLCALFISHPLFTGAIILWYIFTTGLIVLSTKKVTLEQN